MSMMVSFVLSFFPRDVLDEILNLIESVSEDFLTTLIHSTIVFTESFFENSTSLPNILHFTIFYISCENIN